MCYSIAIPVITVLVAVSAGLLGVAYLVFSDGQLVPLPESPNWGPSPSSSPHVAVAKGNVDESIRPFQINISDHVLRDLRSRLQLEAESIEERIADPLEGSGFHWGFTKRLLKTVQQRWLKEYDWRKREALLNAWPHFKTKIFGIDIHFQHVKPTSEQSKNKYKGGTRAVLLLHGWPGSFVEYQNIIPRLLEPEGDSSINFEVVVPSLPGFGFSEAAHRPGLGPPEIAQILKTLMNRLGHQRFYVQGGDWGSIITSAMTTMYQDSILGAHMTLCFSFHPRSLLKFGAALALPSLFLEPEEVPHFTPASTFASSRLKEFAYMYAHATKPETIGVGISYSPSGLAAYILEKFSTWTNPKWLDKEDGGLFPHYDLEPLLDNIMIYWVSSSATTSLRIYAEYFNPWTSSQLALERVPVVEVPVAVLELPNELYKMPRTAVGEKFQNIVRYTRKPETGGHFSTLEDPAMLAADIIKSFNLIEVESHSKEEGL